MIRRTVTQASHYWPQSLRFLCLPILVFGTETLISIKKLIFHLLYEWRKSYSSHQENQNSEEEQQTDKEQFMNGSVYRTRRPTVFQITPAGRKVKWKGRKGHARHRQDLQATKQGAWKPARWSSLPSVGSDPTVPISPIGMRPPPRHPSSSGPHDRGMISADIPSSNYPPPPFPYLNPATSTFDPPCSRSHPHPFYSDFLARRLFVRSAGRESVKDSVFVTNQFEFGILSNDVWMSA